MRFGLAIIAMGLLPVSAQAAEPITGNFMTQNKKAIITIRPCGAAMCGYITKLLPASDAGKTMDERNFDPKLRKRPLVGLQLFIDLVDSGEDWRGDLYSPQDGQTFTTVVRRRQDGSLKVKGCFLRIICKTQIWPAVD